MASDNADKTENTDNAEKNVPISGRSETEKNGKDLHIDLEDLDQENGDQDSNLNETYVIDTAKKTFPQNPVHVKRNEPDSKHNVVPNIDQNELETHDNDDSSLFPQKPMVVNRLTNNVKCDQCGMLFTNSETLRQHKMKFCLGIEESGIKKYMNSSPTQEHLDLKPQNNNQHFINNLNGSLNTTLNNSTMNRTRNEDLDFNMSNDFKLNPYQAQSAINELRSYKNKKSMEQSLRDMEDTLIRDTIRDKKFNSSLNKTPQNLMTTPDQNISYSGVSTNSFNKYIKNSQAKDDPFKFLVKEENEATGSGTVPSSDFLSLFEQTPFDDIDLEYLDAINFTPASNKLVTKTTPVSSIMNDDIRSNLRRIQDKTQQLERERRDIQFKLEALKNNTSSALPVQSNQNINRILSELREQQRVNEAALNMLKQRLITDDNPMPSSYVPTSTTTATNSRYNNPYSNALSTLPPIYSNPISSVYDSSLSPEEIRVMRLNYLQNGGHDQNVLNRFTEMEYNARFKQANNDRLQTVPKIDQKPMSTPATTMASVLNRKNLNGNQFNDRLFANEKRLFDNNNNNMSDLFDLSLNGTFNDNNNNNANHNNSFKTSLNNSKSSNNNLGRIAPQAETFSLKNRYRAQNDLPLMSEFLLANTDQDRNNPLAIELDNKIRKVDSDNKRLQAELERLQNKLTLDNTNSNRNILPPIDNSYSKIKYVPVQETVPNLINQSQRSMQDDFRSPRSNNNFVGDPLYKNPSPRAIRLKDLPPSPYDPVGGFVIFIDFVTNLDPSYACARVITCLHHPKSGLGEPSVLPIVNCEPNSDNGNRTSVALISTKQPVPRCPPQQALTILIELQMAHSSSSETRLKSCAWTKLPLFDSKNRLLSGRWKSQLRNLPIRSDANLSSLGSLPEFGYTEVFYRLVNVRDSDEQTNMPISPAYAPQYYPTVQKNQSGHNHEYLLHPSHQLNNFDIEHNSNNNNNNGRNSPFYEDYDNIESNRLMNTLLNDEPNYNNKANNHLLDNHGTIQHHHQNSQKSEYFDDENHKNDHNNNYEGGMSSNNSNQTQMKKKAKLPKINSIDNENDQKPRWKI